MPRDDCCTPRPFRSARSREEAGANEQIGTAAAYSNRHAAFAWDHNLFNPLVQWAVLEWNGENPEGESFRNDVGYFLDPETGESDARAFRVIRDELSGIKTKAA